MKTQHGFSILEVVVSLAIFSFILLAITSFIFWLNTADINSKATANSLENARTILDIITYEIRGAKSVYTPTTSSSQLSLETSRYLPDQEEISFIDIFLCGQNADDICLKKESQDPVRINSSEVKITNLSFEPIFNGASSSVKISLTVENRGSVGQMGEDSLVTLDSTVSLRSY